MNGMGNLLPPKGSENSSRGGHDLKYRIKSAVPCQRTLTRNCSWTHTGSYARARIYKSYYCRANQVSTRSSNSQILRYARCSYLQRSTRRDSMVQLGWLMAWERSSIQSATHRVCYSKGTPGEEREEEDEAAQLRGTGQTKNAKLAKDGTRGAVDSAPQTED